MTIKDDLHALIDELDELDARDALEFVKARLELEPNVSQSYIGECQAALDEAHAPDAVLIPMRRCGRGYTPGGRQTRQQLIATSSSSSSDYWTKRATAPASEGQMVIACPP